MLSFSDSAIQSYTPRHDVRPKVVATAVKTVMTMFRIFPQSDLFSISYDVWCMMFDLWVNHTDGNSELTTQNNMSTNPVSILILSSKLEGARRFKHFSIEKPPVLHILTNSVVLSVRNRTRIVRIRTLFHTPYFRLFSHYQAINVLARFLLYNKYSNEQILVSLKHD